MTGDGEAGYRLKLAEGFLAEARQDLILNRWRSAVDNAQLAVENAAKSVLALVGPVGRTHNPSVPLRSALGEGLFPTEVQPAVARLTEQAELLGPDVHIQTDYGDELGNLTPWELFDGSDAAQSVTIAEEAVSLAQAVIEAIRR